MMAEKEKDRKWLGYWTNYVTFPCGHTHDLDLEFLRSKLELNIFQERGEGGELIDTGR